MTDYGADEVALTKSDMTKVVPAAKCRDCECITWTVSIADGLNRVGRPKHKDGCTMPPSRLDLLAKIPLSQRSVVLGGVLLKPMSTEHLLAAAKELEWKSPST